MALFITYDKREYILDLDDMDTDEARAMERFGVPNLKAFEDGIGEGDTDSLTVAYWLMLKQNGEPGVRIDRVKFHPIKFLKALGKAAKEESARDAKAAKDAEPEGKDEA